MSSLPLLHRVVQAVAAQADSDPLELPPLYDTVDPEALESAVVGSSAGAMTFRYAGHSVTVDSDETVSVSDGSVGTPTQTTVRRVTDAGHR